MKLILICACLCFSVAACAPTATTSIPTVEISPIGAQTQIPTSTMIPNTPSPTVEVSSSPVATPTEAPNSLTYENSAGQIVTIELQKFEYNGVEMPDCPDLNACMKFAADVSTWYPDGIDQPSLFARLFKTNPDFIELLKQLGVNNFKEGNYNIQSMPSPALSSYGHFELYLREFHGGTLAIAAHEESDGTITLHPFHSHLDAMAVFRHGDGLDYLIRIAQQRP
jgi:hypothetical protein